VTLLKNTFSKASPFLGKALGNLMAFAVIYSFVLFLSLPILVPVAKFSPDWVLSTVIEIDLFIALFIMSELKAKAKRKNSRLH
jgi:uncharacterized membrane protein